jgi:hypothetical protein
VPVRYEVRPNRLTVSPAQLDLVELTGSAAPTSAQLLLEGDEQGGPWQVALLDEAGDAPSTAFLASPTSGPGTPARVTITAVAAQRPAIGESIGGRVVVSRGARQAQVHVGWSYQYPVVEVPTTPIAFAIESQQLALPSQILPIGTQAGTGVPIRCYLRGAATALLELLGCSTAPADLVLRFTRTDAPPGRLSGEIQVLDATGRTDVTVPISVDVSLPAGAIWASPETLWFTITSSTTLAETRQALTLAGTGGAWTAAADAPWLTVAPRAGTLPPGGAATLQVATVRDALPFDQGRVTGTIQLHSTTADGRDFWQLVPVTMEAYRPRLGLAPAYDVAGRDDDLAVAGDVSWIEEVTYDGVPGPPPRTARNGSYWAERRVTPPPFDAGTHQIRFASAVMALPPMTFDVVARRDLSAAVLASHGQKTRLVFDDRTGRLWAFNAGVGAVERYRSQDGWARDTAAWEGLVNGDLLADGAQVALAASNRYGLLDAATLAQGAVQLVDLAPQPGRAGLLARFDGTAATWGSEGCWFRSLDPASGRVDFLQSITTACPGHGGASRSRLTLAFDEHSPGGVPRLLELHQVVDALPAPFASTSLALDRHGDRILLVKDGAGGPGDSALLGVDRLPLAGRLPATIAVALLTQGGDRAVAFDGLSRTVRLFDLTQPPSVATGLFVELGTPGGLAPAADPGGSVTLALSADDRTLFLGGDERIVVHPLP